MLGGSEWSILIGSADLTVGTFGGESWPGYFRDSTSRFTLASNRRPPPLTSFVAFIPGTIFEWCNTEPNGLPTVSDIVYYFNEDTPGVRKLEGSDPDGDSVTFQLVGTTEFGELLFTNPSQGAPEYRQMVEWLRTCHCAFLELLSAQALLSISRRCTSAARTILLSRQMTAKKTDRQTR